jgi:hypothetical protein
MTGSGTGPFIPVLRSPHHRNSQKYRCHNHSRTERFREQECPRQHGNHGSMRTGSDRNRHVFQGVNICRISGQRPDHREIRFRRERTWRKRQFTPLAPALAMSSMIAPPISICTAADNACSPRHAAANTTSRAPTRDTRSRPRETRDLKRQRTDAGEGLFRGRYGSDGRWCPRSDRRTPGQAGRAVVQTSASTCSAGQTQLRPACFAR